MADVLTPEERRGLFGEDAPAASTPSLPPVPQSSSQGLTEEQRRALFGGDQPQAGAGGYQPPSMVEPSDALEAFQAATLSGMGDVAGGIQRIFGFDPTLSTLTQNKLTEQQKTGMAVHPWASGFGRMFGQTAGTLPATLATAYAFPEVAAAPLVSRGVQALPLLVRGGYIGSLTGAENALLTSGQNPQEPLLPRAIHGAEIGALTGAGGGVAEGYAGAGQTIQPNVQASGQRMQSAGVEVLPGNLPRAAGSANVRGGPPTNPQAGQINQGFGNIIGENTPDFTPKNLDTLMSKLGTDVGNAVSGGQIHADVPLTTTGTSPGQTFTQRLQEIVADNPSIPMIKRIVSGPQGILSKVDPVTGEISGAEVGKILEHNGWLQKTARSSNAPSADAANAVEEAVQDAFRQSSNAGQAEAYRLAREKYKLGLAAQEATDSVSGNIVPSQFMSAMDRLYDNAKRLGTGSSLTDQGVQYARDTARLFGGQQSAAPAVPHAGWIPSALGALSGAGLQGALHFLPAALPAAISNPLIAVGAVSVPLAYRTAMNALAHYQNTPAFAADLISRGGNRAMPGIAGTAGSTGVSASQQPWF